jgi:plastocyanin
MNRLSMLPLLVSAMLTAASCGKSTAVRDEVASTPVTRGSVRGHVYLTGPVPENDVLRMSADPMCKTANGGRRVLDDAVTVAPDGALANAFVELVGEFLETPVPVDPVFIDQRGCVYRPRVVGIRAGQALQIRNSDDGLHNVHGVSTKRDSFNVGQPMRSMIYTAHPRDPGILELKCEVHPWMTAVVVVVNHPFFAVTGADGAFSLPSVPTGIYDLRAWHERFGTIVSHVRVDPDREASLDVTYAGRAAPVP